MNSPFMQESKRGGKITAAYNTVRAPINADAIDTPTATKLYEERIAESLPPLPLPPALVPVGFAPPLVVEPGTDGPVGV